MFSRIPPITKALLLVNIAMFVLQWIIDGPKSYGPMLGWLGLWPVVPGASVLSGDSLFMPWQLVTYAFLHGDPMHLLFNMMALVMFGAQLEHYWGSRRYLFYFGVCVLGAGLCQLALASVSVSQGGGAYPTIGASGGVFGLLLGYGMLFPNQRVMLMFPPIPMKARTLVILFGVFELLLGFTGLQPGVAHFAHLGGMLFGGLLLLYWRRSPKPPSSPKRSTRTLRVVK